MALRRQPWQLREAKVGVRWTSWEKKLGGWFTIGAHKGLQMVTWPEVPQNYSLGYEACSLPPRVMGTRQPRGPSNIRTQIFTVSI